MQTIIVVGNGMVGYKFCEKFVAQADAAKYKLIIFGEEPRVAYDRVHLSEFFEDGDAERLSLAPRSWYEDDEEGGDVTPDIPMLRAVASFVALAAFPVFLT